MQRQIMILLQTFGHQDMIVSDGTQRQIMVILSLLSSRGGEPDDMQRQIMIIPHTFCHPDTIVSDGTWRQMGHCAPKCVSKKI